MNIIEKYLTFDIFKTKVSIHWTLLVLFVFQFISTDININKSLHSCLDLLIIYTLVLVHEFGHIFAARKYGYTINEVSMTIFGGLAKLEEEIKDPKALFWVAISGPLTHIFFIAVSFLFLGTVEQETLVWFIATNAVIFIFNMIPIVPMDGGRVLTSIFLHFNKSYTKSNFYASIVGAVLIIPVIVGLFISGSYFAVLIMLFFCINLYTSIKDGIECVKMTYKIKKTLDMSGDYELCKVKLETFENIECFKIETLLKGETEQKINYISYSLNLYDLS